MGLASALGASQNLMDIIFAGFSIEMALVYLDDAIVFRINFDEHLKAKELVFQRLEENGLKIRGPDFKFFPRACQHLGAHYIRG